MARKMGIDAVLCRDQCRFCAEATKISSLESCSHNYVETAILKCRRRVVVFCIHLKFKLSGIYAPYCCGSQQLSVGWLRALHGNVKLVFLFMDVGEVISVVL